MGELEAWCNLLQGARARGARGQQLEVSSYIAEIGFLVSSMKFLDGFKLDFWLFHLTFPPSM